MSYGCIPVLNPVGGNKDILSKNVGLEIDNYSDVSNIEPILKSSEMYKKESKKAVDLQREIYNDEIFLKRYAEAFN